MLKIPFEELAAKIVEKTGLSSEEVNSKINQKLSQLSGLISKEGAATIVANELGVKLVENSGKVKDIYAGMRSVEFLGKVVQTFDVKDFQRQDGTLGKVSSFLAGDETGIIRVVCWGSNADIIKQLNDKTIVRVQNGFVKENNRGFKEVHLGDRSRIIVNPEGETVEVKALPPVVRKKLNELTETDDNVEIFGTVRQVFDLVFFEVCPFCSTRIRPNEAGSFVCQEHGPATNPDYNYVLNLVLDDGTETMRIVLFRNLVDKLLNNTKENILVFKSVPETFETVKNNLLGEQFKLVGRIKKNEFRNNLEFVANSLSKEISEEALEKINEVIN